MCEKNINLSKQEYDVEIHETLSKVVKIKATSKDEAIAKVHSMYKNQEIVLDSEDHIGTDINYTGDL